MMHNHRAFNDSCNTFLYKAIKTLTREWKSCLAQQQKVINFDTKNMIYFKASDAQKMS